MCVRQRTAKAVTYLKGASDIKQLAEDRLADVVTAMARAAALRDPRFTPVRPQEVNGLRIEISVLGPLLPCAPDEVVVGRDGLVVDGLGRRGLLLPEVASDQGWDREAFIRETCRKAGLPSAALDRGARLFSFRTEHFAESP